ncbi:arylamine N-acetyltransferase [Amycolatopsis sp. 195334CR]|uniref:arylamine N-acetyltransferase family protein n=1 Tax=Amycolatopsis sp. 195334CR TaxID=2814588 RepID=UPI001A908CF9|nr:arylamine N-acetyltransferase [Amycolatopsis sp. 195334CR]MBN6034877.1 arylamine N-acetyltransferase [Amycolatopsis sp. 195334CR]
MDAYLTRLGLGERPAADLDGLRLLHRTHLAKVPFENLDIHLGVPVTLTEESLVDKIVHRRRGGICYELNGAFALLLRDLGFEVTLLGAATFREDGELYPKLTHLALRVDLDEPWLVDVGFGRFARQPLRLTEPGEQLDEDGVFTVIGLPTGQFEVHHDGSPVYRTDPLPLRLADLVPSCHWTTTSPESRFTSKSSCSLRTDAGRFTLSGDRLITTVAGERTEETLADDTAILAAYRTRFGVELDRVPRT